METDIQIEGMAQMHVNMLKLQGKLKRQELLKAIKPGARVYQKAVKDEAPVRKGYLRKAFRIKAGRGRNASASATMFVTMGKTYPWKGKKEKPFYAIMVHNGTVISSKERRKHRKSTGAQRIDSGGKVGIKANPFVWRAFNAKSDEVGDMIIDNIGINRL